MKAQRGVEVQLHTFFNLGTTWSGWSTPHPSQFTSGRETRHLLYISVHRCHCFRGVRCFQIQRRQRCTIVHVVITEDGNFMHRLYEYLSSPIALTMPRTAEVHVVDSTDPLPGDRIAWNTILVCRMPSEQRPSAEISPNVVRMPQPLHVLVQVTCVVWSQSDRLADSVLTPSPSREGNSDDKYSYVPYTLWYQITRYFALNELVQPSII